MVVTKKTKDLTGVLDSERKKHLQLEHLKMIERILI